MLTICVGPNGSGKSLWAVHQLVKFLRDEKETRPIVTSLPLDMERLNEYVQQQMGEKAPAVFSRVIRIGPEEQRIFWRHRGIKLDWTDGTDDGEWGWKPIVLGPFGDSTWKGEPGPGQGVIYILDEIQNTFGARSWQQTGPEFVAYQTQHRKFGDDTIAISPASALIEKQFRLLCKECVVLHNMYQERIGWVKAPRKIVYRTFQNCPPAIGEDHTTKGEFRIDREGLASCYRTEEGLGVVGRGNADKGKESKGLPVWAMFTLLGVGCLFAWLVISQGMKFASKKATAKLALPKAVVTTQRNEIVPQEKLVVPPLPVRTLSDIQRGSAQETNVFLTGRMGATLYLSNGGKVTKGWRWVEEGEKAFVPAFGIIGYSPTNSYGFSR